MKHLRLTNLYALFLAGVLFTTSCSNDDDAAPEEENEVEVITDVKLIFTNTEVPAEIVEARAQDPDGTGIQDLKILDTITLGQGKTYKLTYEIINGLNPDDPENIGDEILEEDNEHQFFFKFTDGAFSNPTGTGNIDGGGTVRYEDVDDNDRPVGLQTLWTTTASPKDGGEFRVVLKHQPGVKTDNSGFEDGDTDFDLPFVLIIQ